MERRKFLIGIGSASVGGSALLGSGAFTKVRSQRRAKIEVAEDPDAYLGLDGCPGSPNESYTDFDEDGHLEIEMSPLNEQSFEQNPESDLGLGVNSDSFSWFDDVFEICNQGKQPVCVWLNYSINPELDPVPEDYQGEPRIRFYYLDEDGSRRGLRGVGNAISLEVGECVCVGIRTMTKGLSAGDQIIENDEVIVNADADVNCTDVECPELSGVYECTVYGDEVDEWRRIGTRYRVTNDGPATTFDLAIADSPGSWDTDISVGANTDRTVVSDASVPRRGLVIWQLPEGCVEEHNLETWGEYKNRVGVDDLEDWYESFGTAEAPIDAPQDLSDEAVVEVQDIPEQGVDMANMVGPDQVIDDADFPDMSQAAEDVGWITCAKFHGG